MTEELCEVSSKKHHHLSIEQVIKRVCHCHRYIWSLSSLQIRRKIYHDKHSYLLEYHCTAPISNTTWSVRTNSALLFTSPTMLYMAKVVKVVCLVSKIKPMHWSQIMNTMTSKVNDDDGYIVLMDPMMSDVRWRWSITHILYCND